MYTTKTELPEVGELRPRPRQFPKVAMRRVRQHHMAFAVIPGAHLNNGLPVGCGPFFRVSSKLSNLARVDNLRFIPAPSVQRVFVFRHPLFSCSAFSEVAITFRWSSTVTELACRFGFRGRRSRFSVEEPPDTGPRGFSEAPLRHHSRKLSRYSAMAAVTSGCAPIGAPAALRLRLSKCSKRLWVDSIAALLIRHVAQGSHSLMSSSEK